MSPEDGNTFNGEMAIDLHRVEKKYRGKIHALRGIDMKVHRGEIFGLLGPNGAGKSTLVKILMTIIRATNCEGTLLGKPVGDRPTLARVGYLPEHLRFPDYLTAEQAIDYFAALAKVPTGTRKKRADELFDLVGMTEWRKKKIKTFSKGMKQRIGLAQALMNDPDLILLDEPTDGVDPVGRRDIRNVLMKIKERGKTVFLNSHILSELEMICERVAILSQGLVVKQGTIDDLTRESRRYEIEISGELPENESIAAAMNGLDVETESNEQITRITVYGGDEPDRVQPLIDAIRGAGAVIRSVRPVRQTLEELFMQTVVDPATGQPVGPGAKVGGK